MKFQPFAVNAGVKYSCNQCGYKATWQSHLKTRQQAAHEIVKYSCNRCEYRATHKCGYQAACQYNLKTHQQGVHKKVEWVWQYPCNQYEYQTGWTNETMYYEHQTIWLILWGVKNYTSTPPPPPHHYPSYIIKGASFDNRDDK